MRGIQIAERGLEQFEDALEDVEDAGEDAAEALEDGFKNAIRDNVRKAEDLEDALDEVGREGESAADKVESSFRSALRDVEDAADDVDIDISENIESGASSAKRAAGVLIGEIASELTESWGEAVRSGDYGEAIRETFSNLAQIGGAAFGPVGALGGAGAAALLTGFYDKLRADALRKEELLALSEGISSSLFDLIVERAEEKGTEAGAQFQKAFKSVEFETQTLEQLFGDLPSAMAAITQQAGEWGLEVEVVKDAYLGNADAVATVEQRLADIRALQESNATLANSYLAAGEKVPQTLQDQITALNTAESEMTDLLDAAEGVQVETAKTKAGLETYEELYGKAEKGAKKQKDAAEGTADATGKTKDNVKNTKDKGLPKLEGSTKTAKQNAEGAKKAVENIPSEKRVKMKVDRSEVDSAFTKINGIPGLINTTLSVDVQGANAKANRILASIGNS